jgi:hypothetical protein
MRCERLHELLPGYLDGDLPAYQNQQVSDHLDGCERCREALSAQQRALRALDAGRHPVSIDLWADFSRRLEAQPAPSRSQWGLFWQPSLAVVAAGAAVAIIAGFAARPGPTALFNAAPVVGTKIARVSPTGEAPDPTRHWTVGSLDAGHSRSTGLAVRPVRRIDKAVSKAMERTPIAARPRRSAVRPTSHTWSVPSVPIGELHPARPVLMATLPSVSGLMLHREVRAVLLEAGGDPGPSTGRHVTEMDRVDPGATSQQAESNAIRSGDPLRSFVALSSIEQRTASAQIGGEILRLVREVKRMRGEAPGGGTADGESETQHSGAPSDVSPTGTSL